MISIEKQLKLFENIAQTLKKPITAYAVGGTAMMFLGLKEATLDIDLVFNDKRSKEIFRQAIEALGYRKMDHVIVYGAKCNPPEMLTLGDERFDLFVSEVIDFIFSEPMKERATNIHQFGDKLIIKIANPHDLILMKCATDRLKDKDDARKIITTTNINWNIIIDEAQHQVTLGKTEAIFTLGEFLEDLRKILKERIPEAVIERLWKWVEEQARGKQKKY